MMGMQINKNRLDALIIKETFYTSKTNNDGVCILPFMRSLMCFVNIDFLQPGTSNLAGNVSV